MNKKIILLFFVAFSLIILGGARITYVSSAEMNGQPEPKSEYKGTFAPYIHDSKNNEKNPISNPIRIINLSRLEESEEESLRELSQ